MTELTDELRTAIAEREKASARISTLVRARDDAGARADQQSAEIDQVRARLARALAAVATADAPANAPEEHSARLAELEQAVHEALTVKQELAHQIEAAQNGLTPHNAAVAQAVENLVRFRVTAIEQEAVRLARHIETLLTERLRLASFASREWARAQIDRQPVNYETPGARRLRGKVDPRSPERDLADLISPRSLENVKPVTLAELLGEEPTNPIAEPAKRSRKRAPESSEST